MSKQDIIETIKLYKVRAEYATTRKHRLWFNNRIEELQLELEKLVQK